MANRVRKVINGMKHYNMPHDHGQNIDTVLERMPCMDSFTSVAALFKQMSDSTRLRILWLLCHCEECVSNISAAMQMSDPAVSHHLSVLKKSGLITCRRDGKEVYYKIADNEQTKLLHEVMDKLFEVECPCTES